MPAHHRQTDRPCLHTIDRQIGHACTREACIVLILVVQSAAGRRAIWRRGARSGDSFSTLRWSPACRTVTCSRRRWRHAIAIAIARAGGFGSTGMLHPELRVLLLRRVPQSSRDGERDVPGADDPWPRRPDRPVLARRRTLPELSEPLSCGPVVGGSRGPQQCGRAGGCDIF